MTRRIFLAAIALCLAQPAGAHEWYPIECCSGVDCSPVEKVETLPIQAAGVFSGARVPSVMVVTTKHGSAIVPPTMERRQSQDSRMHACIHGGKVVCLFDPPGN